MNDRKIIEFFFSFFFFSFSLSVCCRFLIEDERNLFRIPKDRHELEIEKWFLYFHQKIFSFFPIIFFLTRSFCIVRSIRLNPINSIPWHDKESKFMKIKVRNLPEPPLSPFTDTKTKRKCTEEREEWVSRGGEEEGRNFAKLWAGLVFKFTNSKPEKTCRVQGPGSESPSTTTTTTTKKKRRNEVGGFREISFLNEGP